MDKKTTDQIFSFFSGLKNHKEWDTGLNGRSAVVLFLFRYSKLKNNIDAYNKGIELLEYELNELEHVTNFGLLNGLSGIAWTVNYLSTENLVDIESDDILPELLENDFKNVFFSKEVLVSELQFKTNSDIFFYFIERYATTQCDSLKKNYLFFLNQAFILFTHFFYQIEKHKFHEHFNLSGFVSFIKLLNFANTIFYSPLSASLLSKSINWSLSKGHLSQANSLLFLESAANINDKSIIEKIKKVPIINDHLEDDIITSDNENKIKNIGIWNGYSKKGLELIAIEDNFQKNSFKYIFEAY